MRDLPAVSMAWHHGLFAHWPVAPERVRSLVPDALDLDAREGTAWVSALPSVVVACRPAGLPASVGLSFPQVNFRTYVRHEGRSGVYFLSLDTTTGLGVRFARRLYGLPYYRADIDVERGVEGDVELTATAGEDPTDAATAPEGREPVNHSMAGNDPSTPRDAETVRFEARRPHTEDPPARFAATYRPTGRPSRAAPDSLDHFLAERYRTFVVRNGTVWCARVEHRPWPLCPAEASVHADALFEAVGLPAPAEEPVVRYAPRVDMTVRTPFRP